MIRKFYDLLVEDASKGGDEGQALETAKEVDSPSVASLMARQGVKNSGMEMVATPIHISETKEETKTTEAETPAATAKEEVKVEKVETETPKQEEQKPEASTAQVEFKPTVEAKAEFNLQEVLKSQQPEAVLQALGFDGELTKLSSELKDFKGEELTKAVGLLQAVKEGKANEYLRELSTDYSTMPAEEVMRHQLRLEYPKASERQIEVLFKKEVIEKYNLDSVDEDEVEEGRLLLDTKADKYRDDFIANQAKYLTPKASEKSNEPVIDEEEIKHNQLVERVTKEIKEDPYTQSLIANNKITIGEGEEAFNFPIDGRAIENIILEGGADYLWDKAADGSPKAKIQLQALSATVQKYGMGFIDELIKHGKSLGGKKAIDPIDNAKPVDQKTANNAEIQPKTPAEWMARKGTLNSGG